MVSGANVLGIGCTTNEVTTSAGLTNEILTSYWGWLSNNPTKHPQYVVCFLDIPSRVYDSTNVFPSVFVYIREATSGVRPFVTCINMETTNDCRAYIDKIRYFGTNYSPGKLVISASRGNYSNTNYYFDDALPGTLFCTNGVTGVLEAGGFQSSITYVPPSSYNQHIRNGTNVAGYVSWGANGSFVHTYAIDGTVTFRGESAWCLIQTVESWNGLRDNSGSLQSHFLDWFSPSAFGGTNYQNTAVGAVSHVHEPNLPGVNDPQLYFGLWQKGKTFSVCAWQSRITPYFQAVGDPLTAK